MFKRDGFTIFSQKEFFVVTSIVILGKKSGFKDYYICKVIGIIPYYEDASLKLGNIYIKHINSISFNKKEILMKVLEYDLK